MNAQLQTSLVTVREILAAGDEEYVVPIYQRGYAWGAQEIEQLLTDVFDEQRAGRSGYFVGNLVTTRCTARGRTTYEVVDGQQRLTTLHLIMAALNDGSEVMPGRLTYSARPGAAAALRRVGSQHAGMPLERVEGEDESIIEGYEVVRQFLATSGIIGSADLALYRDFLLDRVTMVRAVLPSKTDLNRYFEIMNTRGEQLQQVDIVKAMLMSKLDDDVQRTTFARVWDACASMDYYVPMTLAKDDPALRTTLFGPEWGLPVVRTFDELSKVLAGGTGQTTALTTASMSLAEAIIANERYGVATSMDLDDSVRFSSTLAFSPFLLHVLAIVDEVEPHDSTLDDKRLIERFRSALLAVDEKEQGRWAKEFAVALLTIRTLFDTYVIKREYTQSSGEDGAWSLKRLRRGESATTGSARPQYASTFGTPTGNEEEGASGATRRILLLESMLRVTYTSPRTMRWITELLGVLYATEPQAITPDLVENLLMGHARQRVREAYDFAHQPTGFNIPRIVFTYLDYLYALRDQNSSFEFVFRTSIEHFYPQHPDLEQSGARVSAEHLDTLGNLALVSVSDNSKFSNSLPLAKAQNFRHTIRAQSTKLDVMSALTEKHHGWSDAEVVSHHREAVSMLAADLGISD